MPLLLFICPLLVLSAAQEKKPKSVEEKFFLPMTFTSPPIHMPSSSILFSACPDHN